MLATIVRARSALSQPERGATTVQYGTMVALIATAVIVVVGAFGDHVHDAYQSLVEAIPGGR